MAYSWFRLYSEMRTDPKMLRLTPAERWCWVGLLCMASESSDRGLIQIADGVPYEEIELAHALDVSIEDVQGVLSKGEEWHMLHREIDGLRILDFRQPHNVPVIARERPASLVSAWRGAIFARDNYTCQVCGKRGGPLNAHHRIAWVADSAKRFDLDNGITLCVRCHRTAHHQHRAGR